MKRRPARPLRCAKATGKKVKGKAGNQCTKQSTSGPPHPAGSVEFGMFLAECVISCLFERAVLLLKLSPERQLLV